MDCQVGHDICMFFLFLTHFLAVLYILRVVLYTRMSYIDKLARSLTVLMQVNLLKLKF